MIGPVWVCADRPSLLAFARPGQVLFGGDWPFSSDTVVGYFTSPLEVVS